LPEKYDFVSTCLFGLEHFVAEDIAALGYERTDTIDGHVTFRAPIEAIAECNVNFGCAERVLLLLGEFRAETFDELFEGVRALQLEHWVGRDGAFPVRGHSVRSKLHSVPDCQKIIKKAAATRLGQHYHYDWLRESGPVTQIEFFIFNDVARIMLDTTGVALHKRGWRPAAMEAPLRETLANALVRISRAEAGTLFWDPMCGSGTIPIEAARYIRGEAPGALRHFAAEHWPCLDQTVFYHAKERAAANIRRDVAPVVVGTDVDPAAVKMAHANASRAGVDMFVKFRQMDAMDIKKPAPDIRGTVVCNPPYGERLGHLRAAEQLYRNMGAAFARLEPWHVYVLTADEMFEQFYGRRADKARKLYNGMIKCNLYQYFKFDKPAK